jgi:hypothetical protein
MEPRVPLDLTALNSPDDTVGPSFGVFGAVGVRGFAMFKDIKPSPHELPNAEMARMRAACP